MAPVKIILLFTIIIGITACTNGQVIKPGKCPQAKVIDNFDVAKYLGKWYEQLKYPAPFEMNGKCCTAEYTPKSNNTITVVNSMIDKNTEGLTKIEGSAQIVENAKLLVKFPTSPEGNDRSNYWVLDTDYNSYSVIFSCAQFQPETNYQIVWILTRERNVDDKLLEKAKNVLTKNGISLNELQETDQVTKCYN